MKKEIVLTNSIGQKVTLSFNTKCDELIMVVANSNEQAVTLYLDKGEVDEITDQLVDMLDSMTSKPSSNQQQF